MSAQSKALRLRSLLTSYLLVGVLVLLSAWITGQAQAMVSQQSEPVSESTGSAVPDDLSPASSDSESQPQVGAGQDSSTPAASEDAATSAPSGLPDSAVSTGPLPLREVKPLPDRVGSDGAGDTTLALPSSFSQRSVPDVTTPDPFDGPGAIVDLGLKLLLVVALAYAALALLRRFGPGSTWRVRNGQIRVLESTVLAPNRAVYLVRAADRQLLLGVTPTQITPLAEWDVDQPASNGVASVPFATLVGPDPGAAAKQ